MSVLFWISVAFVLYAYLGYPFVVLLWPAKRSWRRAPFEGPISFVVVVRNEASRVEAKVRHLLSLPYLAGTREIIFVSDGSNDGTPEALDRLAGEGKIRAFHQREHRGKASALNIAAAAASGEILIFNDARQKMSSDALGLLLENFSDPAVGCVSGELHFENEHQPGLQSTLYWKFERWLRAQESLLGTCMGATGAFYAIRRSLFQPLPEGLLLDDVYTPLQIALRGFRVVHDPRAVLWDVEAASEAHEFRRKVRTLTGNYQLLNLLPGLRSPSRIAFQFFSHKVSRLLAPFFLVLCLISSGLLPGAFYRLVFLLQCAFYAAAAFGAVFPRLPGALRIPYAFVLLNAAAVAALLKHLRGDMNVWKN